MLEEYIQSLSIKYAMYALVHLTIKPHCRLKTLKNTDTYLAEGARGGLFPKEQDMPPVPPNTWL